MKTTTDIAQLLRRMGTTLSMSYNETTGKFRVYAMGGEGTSKHLADALENMAEELRRADSGSGPMRDRPVEAKQIAPQYQLKTIVAVNPAPANPPLPSISQAAQQAYQQQAASSPCATCGGAGFVNSTFFGPLPCGKCFGVGKVAP